MKGLIGRKVGMTHLFRANGDRIAVTVLQVGPCVVAQQKTDQSDGYRALQLAFEPVLDARKARDLAPEQRERLVAKRVAKPQRGHFDKADLAAHRVLREIRVDEAEPYPVGTVFGPDVFRVTEHVSVTAISKGKGFQGAMKRHGFKGQGASHGAKIHRKPASAGATDAARVFKGKRSPGQMGNHRVTTSNLIVELVDTAQHLIALRGSVPGPEGGLVMVLGQGEFPLPGTAPEPETATAESVEPAEA